MDDFNVSSLHESKNEWGSRLLTILTPHIVDGLRSIFEEAVKLCKDNNEMDKYLMTFQNFITRIPKWNPSIIEIERKRIVEKSGCNYLEDLVTCVHIIQLKLLTAIRVGQKQRKLDVSIPKLDDFIHKIYVNVARKVYKNVYLFEINIPPLQVQKHFRELEIIVQECILNTVRDSIPVESILQAYMDQTVEEDVVEEIKEQVIEQPIKTKEETQIIKEGGSADEKVESTVVGEEMQSTNEDSQIKTLETTFVDAEKSSSRLSFNDVDYTMDEHNNEVSIEAPKDVDRLEQISVERNAQRKLESDEDDGDSRLRIMDEDVRLDSFDVHNIEEPEINLIPDLLLDDIEVLA
jgi:hypothetical protein